MSESKFLDLLKDLNSTCDPEICDGECQGMGSCKVAIKFREEEIPKILACKSSDININLTGD